MPDKADDEPEDVRRKKHRLALIELEKLVLREMGVAAAASKADPSPANEQWLNDAADLVAVVQDNAILDYGDPRKYDTVSGLVSAVLGVIGFDEVGNARIDEQVIVRNTCRELVGNVAFQRLANAHFQETDGTTLDFTQTGRLRSSNISPLSYLPVDPNRYRN